MEDNKRDNVKSVRFSDDEIKLIEIKAKEADRKTADFIRIATLKYIEFSESVKKQ